MKRPTFFESVALAFCLSLVGGVVFTALSTVFPGALVLRLLIAGIGLGYVVYLLSRTRERVGRITALGGWAVAAGAVWVVAPPLTVYVLVHLGLIWLIRSLYFYSSVLSALADLGLSSLGLAAAVWAATLSHSVFLSIWCFFLVQALFVAIPEGLRRNTGQRRPERDQEDPFQRAARVAEAALRKLSTAH